MKERIIELETRLAFQEQTIQVLNGALVDQQHQIDGLRRELEKLRERLRARIVTIAGISSEPAGIRPQSITRASGLA